MKNNSQHGFYLVEAIVMLSVLISLMSLGARYITKSAEHSVNQVTAQHLKKITRAAQQYVQDHYQAFTDDPSKKLQWQELVDNGYLPSNMSHVNHYGHAYQFSVANDNGILQIILTTEGGNPISEASLREIAAIAGDAAGYATVLHKNKIVGNFEGWFLNGMPLALGHLASLTFINGKEVIDANTFLRRTNFTGHPGYNQMETNLLMANHDIVFGEDNSTTISKDRLMFNIDKKVNIDISSTGYPYIQIKDGELAYNNIMRINSGDISITKGKSEVQIKVDRPEINIRDGALSETNTMRINSGDISITKGKNEVDIRVDEPGIYIQGEQSCRLKSNELSFNYKSIVTKDYVHIPEHTTDHMYKYGSVTKAATAAGCDGEMNTAGRLFMVHDGGYARHLVMCIPQRKGSKQVKYWIVATGDSDPSQSGMSW